MPNPLGSFIWYELMTEDVPAAKRFYDSVVGWDIDPNTVAPGVNYRMIKRSDGGMAGGVILGGIVGDRIGPLRVIWFSILGVLPLRCCCPMSGWPRQGFWPSSSG